MQVFTWSNERKRLLVDREEISRIEPVLREALTGWLLGLDPCPRDPCEFHFGYQTRSATQPAEPFLYIIDRSHVPWLGSPSRHWQATASLPEFFPEERTLLLDLVRQPGERMVSPTYLRAGAGGLDIVRTIRIDPACLSSHEKIAARRRWSELQARVNSAAPGTIPAEVPAGDA